MWDFVYNISGLSQSYLIPINAHEINFYHNLTLDESLMIILNRMIKVEDKKIPTKNRFPCYFNFQKGQENKILHLNGGKTWYASLNSSSTNFNRLGDSVIDKLNLENSGYKLLFHGTSMRDAIRISSRVKVTTRGECTDFGMYNFYTTDMFYTACEWATKNEQAAVVIFAIPSEKFDEWNVKNFFNTNEWKYTVFRLRNSPDFSDLSNYNNLLEEYEKELNDYEKFVDEIDSYDVVVGPIMSNPKSKSIQEVKFIVNNDNRIPNQFSFKKTSVEELNSFLVTTVFFRHNT